MPQDDLTIQEAWNAVRSGLRRTIGARTFDGWLKPLNLSGFDRAHGELRLAAPSSFMANWVETHFHDHLLQAWRAMLPGALEVDVYQEV